ncbi:MAG: polar amino acid transport system substrate-binding protein [Pseudonocardiales bacterium]|jgi:polar amino acid transport system substrate-binding protein|nr:polar amino acid transport system substrate-binding protein [Pseudonocardiales bacterium]
MNTKALRLIAVPTVVVVASVAFTACSSSKKSGPVASASCTPVQQVTTIKKGVLTVALTNTPPYSFQTGDHLDGIDSGIVTTLAKADCLSVEFAPYTYATAIPAIKAGRADVAVGGFYRTAARAAQVTLSDPAYLDEMTAIAKSDLSTVDSLVGKKVGTVDGYLWVAALKAISGIQARVYPDSQSLSLDLKSGRLDVAIDGYGAAITDAKGMDYKLNVIAADPRIPATGEPSQTCILIDPSEGDLATALNTTIGTLRSNGQLVTILGQFGLPASAATVGTPRVIS